MLLLLLPGIQEDIAGAAHQGQKQLVQHLAVAPTPSRLTTTALLYCNLYSILLYCTALHCIVCMYISMCIVSQIRIVCVYVLYNLSYVLYCIVSLYVYTILYTNACVWRLNFIYMYVHICTYIIYPDAIVYLLPFFHFFLLLRLTMKLYRGFL